MVVEKSENGVKGRDSDLRVSGCLCLILVCCCAGLSRSAVSNSATPWTVAGQAPLSMGILQARILEWVDMPSSKGSSQARDLIQVSRMASRFFTI